MEFFYELHFYLNVFFVDYVFVDERSDQLIDLEGSMDFEECIQLDKISSEHPIFTAKAFLSNFNVDFHTFSIDEQKMKDYFVNIVQHKIGAVLRYFDDMSEYFLKLESCETTFLYF